MRTSDLRIMCEDLQFDDFTLLQMYNKLKKVIAEKEAFLKKTMERADDNNYLCLAMAKLSYGFAKEEFDTVFEEIEKRGLITMH